MNNSYPTIYPHQNFLKDSRISLCVADSFFKNKISFPTLYIEALESNKSLSTCEKILTFFYKHNLRKDQYVLGIGGGIVQDLVSLSCCLYLRGVPWLFMPTTTLCAMDACLGGKNAVNFFEAKNIIGSYYDCEEIAIDFSLFKSLPEIHYRNGFFEAAKTCACIGLETFKEYIALFQKNEVDKIVLLSLKSKQKIVQQDRFDHNIRLLLNFGHTFGHAFESTSKYEIPHGFCVGLGILTILKIAPNSEIKFLLIDHIQDLLKGYEAVWKPFYDAFHSSIDLQNQVMNFMMHDKKIKKSSHEEIVWHLIYPDTDNVIKVFSHQKMTIKDFI